MKELFRVETLNMKFMDDGTVMGLVNNLPLMGWKVHQCAVWTMGFAGNRLGLWLEARSEVQTAYYNYLASEVLK